MMMLAFAPKKQINHKYINESVNRWLDIHFGDTSFNGRVVIGHRKPGRDGVYTMSVRPLSELRPYVKMIHASSRLDYYITANTVSGVDRRTDELFGLQNIVIDIDCHVKRRKIDDLTEAFVWLAKNDLFGTAIPAPNSIVYTGRGVQLWWALVPCYGGRSVNIYYHNYIKKALIDQIEILLDQYSDRLEGLEVDQGASTNLVGFFRMPCTFNTKARRYGSIEVLHGERHEHLDFVRELPSPRREESSRGSQEYVPLLKSDRAVLQGFYGAGARRVIQLTKLRSLRDNEEGAEQRNFFNYMVYNALCMSFDHEEAMVRLRAFNSGFKKPMTEREIRGTICTSRKKGGYRYTNAKFYEALVEFFNITPEEQRAIGLLPYASKKPNASRDAVRKTLKEDRDHKIVELVESGISQAETARILGIGKNTVWRVLKRLATVEAPMGESVQAGEIEYSSRHQNGSIYGLLYSVAPAHKYAGVVLAYPRERFPALPSEVEEDSS